MSEPGKAPPPPGGEVDRLLEHNYDGIQEYDNPMPRWWVYLFWGTIVWSLLYVLNVPWIGVGRSRIENYERDLEAARKKYATAGGPQASSDVLLAVAKDPARLAEGKTQFQTTCSPCHREDGGGVIGPNLTDAYWIHGGRPTDLFRTVTEGVADKGMPAWGQVLSPAQVTAVVGYVLTLRGTHPANPKEPQGVNADSAAAVAPAGGDSPPAGVPPGPPGAGPR